VELARASIRHDDARTMRNATCRRPRGDLLITTTPTSKMTSSMSAQRSSLVLAAFLSAFAALAAACAAPSSTAVAPASSAPVPPEPASATMAAPSASVAPSLAATPAAPENAAPDDLVGKTAPDFTGKAQDGTSVHLAALKGKRVVVYFYPKDETPGCTKEACSFRDAWQDIAKTGAVLVGISADSSDSHKDFVAHYKLPFLLLSDPEGKIGETYGVPFSGHHQRQTFVIGADGKVLKVYRKVDVTVHASQILDDLTHA
jgi:peroxiredoxin Q/BCP